MRGYLETLTMPELGIDDRTRTRYLEIVGDETERLERIIGDLLDLARLEGGGGTLSIADIPAAELFARVAARHERRSTQAGVAFRTVIEAGAERLRGDRDRLEQALQNLAANALRYAPKGTAVELRARPVPGGIAVTVTDEGSGIAPEHLPHVFDRFYKVDASRTPHSESVGGGSGLGLSIVKAIVERHGGTASVTSVPGRTVFELRIKN
jgi:signal transduction histidine kinase